MADSLGVRKPATARKRGPSKQLVVALERNRALQMALVNIADTNKHLMDRLAVCEKDTAAALERIAVLEQILQVQPPRVWLTTDEQLELSESESGNNTSSSASSSYLPTSPLETLSIEESNLLSSASAAAIDDWFTSPVKQD